MKLRSWRAATAAMVMTWTCAAMGESTPSIPGVVAADTPVELLRDGYESVEGPLPRADDSVLFTNARAHRIERLAADGTPSVWWEGEGGANALTVMPDGDIATTLTERRAIGIVRQGEPATVLVEAYDGTPFNRPNDLVASRRGDIYFSDTAAAAGGATATLPAALYLWSAKGELVRLDTDVGRPNGVALSPDERTLYAADTGGVWVRAYTLGKDGRPTGRRDFARLALPAPPADGPAPTGAGADGLLVDARGRLFVATSVGVQVFSPGGEPLGTIALPKIPQNLAFAGAGRRDLVVVGRGAVYRIHTQTRGVKRTGK